MWSSFAAMLTEFQEKQDIVAQQDMSYTVLTAIPCRPP